MKGQIRKDNWSAGVFILFTLDRFSKLFANKGISLELGPISYTLAEASQIMANISVRERAFIIIPPVILVFWVFYKCGGMKPKIWTMLFLAGMVGQTYDLLMRSSFEYCFVFSVKDSVTVFSLATLYLFIGSIAGIFDLAFEAIKDKN
ncbi:MAG: hypothetical protein GXZ00_04670 [Synergistaceae bacterium]|jgi:lipoprotein signal peptidase|nr:hypothetical protein [Synergistaceae bacterium]